MAYAEPSINSYAPLKSAIQSYIKYSRRWMRFWGVIYYGLRTSLIVLSACVAAKGTFGFVDSNVRIFSILVAIGTALDTWLKTGNRYKGHYTFNDKFIGLCTDLELTNSTDSQTVSTIQIEFKHTLQEYAAAVLPT